MANIFDGLQFVPENFINNLTYMGSGMLGVFMIIFIIIAATSAITHITSKKK